MLKPRTFVFILILFILCSCTEESTSPDKGLNAPLNLTLNQVGWDRMELNWVDNNQYETSFRVDRKFGDLDWEESYRTLSENSISFSDSNLVDIGNYSYRIYAVNDEEISGFTEASFEFSYNEVVIISVLPEDDIILYPLESRNIQFGLFDNESNLVEREYQICLTLFEASTEIEINGSLITPSDSLFLTSSAGLVDVNLTAGNEEGSITLKAAVRNSQNNEINTNIEIVVDHQYPQVASLQFLNPGEIALYPYESTEISVELLDEFGDTVVEEYEVFFEFYNVPNGTNLNNTLYGTNDTLSVHTINGIATVSLNSGNSCGDIRLRVFTYPESGSAISLIRSNLLVQPVQSASIELSWGGVNEGQNIGGGLWRVQIAAYIEDINGNPCADGVNVYFSIENDPTYATIETYYAYVGNFNEVQDSVPGTAFSYLTYDGAHINDLITVNVQIADLAISQDIVLPLQHPHLDVIAVPNHFEWIEDDNPEYKDIELRILLRDGQGNPINKQLIIFEAEYGLPLEPTPGDTGDPYTGLTGVGMHPPYDGESGVLFKYIRFYRDEFPVPAPDPIPIQVLVNLSIPEADLTTTVGMYMCRFIE